MRRTSTIHQAVLTFPSGNTFTLQTPAHPTNSVELKFAVGSDADTGLHWHEQHDEFFEVVQGVGRLTLEGSAGILQSHFVAPRSGVVHIPRYRRHCLGRGDRGSPRPSLQFKKDVVAVGNRQVEIEEWEKVLLVREWTDPRDGEKEIFFRNIAGVVNEPKPPLLQNGHWLLFWIWGWWVEWQIWVIGARGDNFPAILEGKRPIFERLLVHLICWMAVFSGKAIGLKGRYDEYTPLELRGEKTDKKVN